MRYLSVCAGAFGPFPANARLELAPGMNVLFGANEAGKSSWHAALYAGLCGMRRRQGRQEPADQLFAEQHRPWHGAANGAWVVTATIALCDGRQFELRHDLAARTAGVTDPVLGRPVELDIMHEGAPDGARLLGLDRRAFLATACVRQSELLGVRSAALYLQEYLQKAVATGRHDATVQAALGAIERYRNDFLGTDRINSGRPLRKALDALPLRRRELEEAQWQHEQHLELLAQAGELQDQAAAARGELQLLEARLAMREACDAASRLEQVRGLQAEFPAGPPRAAGEDALANRVAGALATWSELAPAINLTGPTSAELEALLDALPIPPPGDQQPHAAVQAARDRLQTAVAVLAQHDAEPPPAAQLPPTGGCSEEELRRLAYDLRPPGPHPARPKPSTVSSSGGVLSRGLMLTGAALLTVGAVLLLVLVIAGIALLAGGLAALLAGILVRPGSSPAGGSGAWLEQPDERRRVEALRTVRAAGLPADPAALEALAREHAAGLVRLEQSAGWESRRRELIAVVESREDLLRSALQARGVLPGSDLLADFAGYCGACRQRAGIAVRAQRRPDVAQQLEARRAAERQAATAAEAHGRAARIVLQAAHECGLPAASPDQAAAELRRWQQARTLQLVKQDTAHARWTELQRLLDGRSIAQLEAEARGKRAEADAAAALLPAAALADTALPDDIAQRLPQLRRRAEDLAREHANLAGRIESAAARLPPVAEASEAAAAAEQELARLQRLGDTLDLTQKFLQRAQERVHHDVAPLLSLAISARLPRITGGRYAEVRVDPADLTVRVQLAGGALRPAHLLSHGTAEQVYLLLRVAMAERLAGPGEVCPLILDDVTVQSDAQRTAAILDALLALSTERQVILFSQEEDVLAWARAHLAPGVRDRLQVLETCAAAP